MAQDTADTEVLIAGAGPTGLVLALWLARMGIRVRIIDKVAEPGTTSRALVVHARTLEFYRQIGLADDLVANGLKFAGANFWVKGERKAHVLLGDIGTGLSRFPYMMVFPQDEHERFLIEHLAAAGVRVERPVELLGFEEADGGLRARLRLADGTEETCKASYLAGCDGARSKVREVLNTGFPGGTYARMFYVADVEASGPVMNGELNLALDDNDFLAVFPMSGEGRARIIGTVLEGAAGSNQPLAWEDVSKGIFERTKIDVRKVNWFSTYHVHHRVTTRFRGGRAFLLGDAAHIHSPVGGQGMNTGIGDAVNLAWKLANVLRGRAHERLLDTYEPERIAFAHKLVGTTDRAFTFVTANGPIARFVRLHLVSLVLPVLFRIDALRRLAFRTVSQIGIEYRESKLSRSGTGEVQGGDRLPWVLLDDRTSAQADNFAPLAALEWQVHVYGEVAAGVSDVCKKLGLNLHAFAWRESMQQKGLKRNAAYLLRPDGYVALADTAAATLETYAGEWGLRPL